MGSSSLPPATSLRLDGTRAYIGVRLEKILFGWIACALYLAALGLFFWISLRESDLSRFLVAAGLLLFSLHVVRHFIDDELGDDRPDRGTDAGSVLSFDMVRSLSRTPSPSAGDIFAAAAATERGRFILDEMGIDAAALMQRCRASVDETIDVLPYLQYAERLALGQGDRAVDGNIILLLLFEHVPVCQQVLNEADLSVEDLEGLLQWESFHHRFRTRTSSLDCETIRLAGGVGRSWIMGYTDALDWLTEPIPAERTVAGEGSVIIHKDSIESILSVLSRSTLRNVLVLGKHGVGKRTLVRNVSWALRDHERQRHLPYTRMLGLKVQQLLSGTASPDAFLLKAFAKAENAGRYLIVIEDLAVFLKSASQPLLAVLLKFLQARSIAIVGIADTQDYHTLVKTNAGLDSLFEKLMVDAASDDDTMRVLMAHYFTVARGRRITVTYKALKAIMDLSRRYLSGRGGFPGKAMEVFDDVILRAEQLGDKTVREDHVRDVVSQRSRVNVQKVTEGERDKLLQLE